MQSPLALHSLEDDGIAKFYGMQSVAQLNTYEAIHLCNWRPAAARALRVQGESTRQTRSHGVISWSLSLPPPHMFWGARERGQRFPPSPFPVSASLLQPSWGVGLGRPPCWLDFIQMQSRIFGKSSAGCRTIAALIGKFLCVYH